MKRKLSFLFLSALTIPFFMVSCSDDKEEQEVKPATDLVVDNNSVTLLQGDEITVSITSGNGDYYVKPFDENVATATINGNKVTIKATENSQLEENNRTETTILILENEATSLIIGGYEASTEIAITRGMVIISWHNSQMIINLFENRRIDYGRRGYQVKTNRKEARGYHTGTV